MQQHNEQTGNAGVCYPQDRSGKAEHEVNWFRDRSQRSSKCQRNQNSSSLFAVFLASAEDEGCGDPKIAKGFGKSSVHPDDAIGEGQTHAVFHHHNDVGAGISGIAYGQAVAQSRELERGVDKVMQASWNEETLQKTVQEQTKIAGGCNQVGQSSDGTLHRRPEEAGTKTKQDGEYYHAGERPASARVDLGDDSLKVLLAGVVVYPTADQTKNNATKDTHINGLDTEYRRLASAVQTDHGVCFGQHSKLVQGDVASGQIHQIAHQGDDTGLMLVLLSQSCCNTYTEHQAQVVDDDHDAVVNQLTQYFDRRPLQDGKHCTEAGAGEQCAQYQNQAGC